MVHVSLQRDRPPDGRGRGAPEPPSGSSLRLERRSDQADGAIQVTIEGNQVTIGAEVKRQDEQKEGERVLRSERYYGNLFRSFTLPVELDEQASAAKFENGVLELQLARKQPVAGRKLAIQ